MTVSVQVDPEVPRGATSASGARIETDGKFLRAGDERFLVKGVTYGTFAPDAEGYQFPPMRQIAEDFRLMAGLGLNTVRVYTPPRRDLLDEAARHGLRVMVGLPWSQHVAFLDDRSLRQDIRREVIGRVRELGDHPAVLMFALGNEIPPGVVRWHGRLHVERFLRRLYDGAKTASPDSLFTYVNFPPTEFLDLSCFDVCAFNVYLHRETELRAYLARLQHVAGHQPLLIAEAGADSIREGEAGQAAITAAHVRVAFEEGCCGAMAFGWTDEWWRGGHNVDDWRSLVTRERRPKPARAAAASTFADASFSPKPAPGGRACRLWSARIRCEATLEDCLSSLERPHLSRLRDHSGQRRLEIARARLLMLTARPRVDTPNAGLSAARNAGSPLRPARSWPTPTRTRVDPGLADVPRSRSSPRTWWDPRTQPRACR